MEPSHAVEAIIRERCHKLEQYGEHITCFRITIDAPSGPHQHDGLYTVTIDLTLSDEGLIVSRRPEQHHAHEDIYVAIRDGVDAARRQLEDYARRQRAEIKLHTSIPHGQIAELLAQDD